MSPQFDEWAEGLKRTGRRFELDQAAQEATEKALAKPEPDARHSGAVSLDGLEVEVYRSEIDGRLVVQIDGIEEPETDDDVTEGNVPACRIYINDGRVYENSPERGEEYGE